MTVKTLIESLPFGVAAGLAGEALIAKPRKLCMIMVMRIRLVTVWLLLGILPFAAAQNANAPESAGAAGKDRVQALRQVIDPLKESRQELSRLRGELEQAEGEEERTSLQSQIATEEERLANLRGNFRSILGGAEAAEYQGASEESLSLEKLAVDLLAPISRAVRDASASPRELDLLREELATWQVRERKCEIILRRIDDLQQQLEGLGLQSEFDSAKRYWQGRRAECRGKIGVLNARIQERVKKQRPLLETLSDTFSAFFRSRGLNLLIALVTGVLVFVLSRKLYAQLCKFSPLHRGKATLASRLADILAALLTVLLTLMGVMMVFYIRGDWLLLTLVVLFLIGAVWAGKTSLPPYIEQVRTLLNLGSIREGERVVYEGIPWRVKSIGFLTILDNPRLQGGEYRIPVRHVMHMISRQPDDREPWFPTECDDWVLLGDETYGKVVTQTPEQVVVLRLGGSCKTYATADFLAQTPENLSHGYRISCAFGVDYQHQAISTSELPEKLQMALTAGLHQTFEREQIRSIKVEFLSAGASSLDYQILVDVSGGLDSRMQVIERQIQKICVDACNEEGWVIPFTQITVHQAEA